MWRSGAARGRFSGRTACRKLASPSCARGNWMPCCSCRRRATWQGNDFGRGHDPAHGGMAMASAPGKAHPGRLRPGQGGHPGGPGDRLSVHSHETHPAGVVQGHHGDGSNRGEPAGLGQASSLLAGKRGALSDPAGGLDPDPWERMGWEEPPAVCVACGSLLERFTAEGIPYCEAHYPGPWDVPREQ